MSETRLFSQYTERVSWFIAIKDLGLGKGEGGKLREAGDSKKESHELGAKKQLPGDSSRGLFIPDREGAHQQPSKGSLKHRKKVTSRKLPGLW